MGGTPVVNLGSEGIDKVDALRRRLAKVDIMLGDIHNIIEGYVRFRTAPPPESTNEQNTDSFEMEQIEDKLMKFKEMLNAQSNQEPEEAN